MDFSHDAKTEELRGRLLAFMDEHVYPAEAVHRQQIADVPEFSTPPVVEELKAKARELGLWNLFLPHHPLGAGLSNVQYAPLAEITGRSPHLAPEALNCNAPDTGNMEVLAMFGTPEQQERWLKPLLDGTIRSAFGMTEPDVASSDATNIGTQIERDGDTYAINGRKWWSSGAMNPRAEIFIVMGKTDPHAERHRQQSMILVPRDTPGVSVRRSTTVFGYADRWHGGHAEVVFDNVRVPATNLIGGEGDGFAIAQARLGPGPHPPLHAADRHGRAGLRADVPPRQRTRRVRQAAGRAGRGRRLDRRVARTHRAGPATRAQDRLAHGHRRQPGRAHRDPGHQDCHPVDGRVGHRQGHPGARRWRA